MDLIKREDARNAVVQSGGAMDAVAAINALTAVQVVAGQLGWTPLQNGAFADAFGLAGFYRVVGVPGLWELHRPRGVAMHVDDGFDTQAAAKAAAEADYEARIRSALTAQPAPDVARIGKVMRYYADTFCEGFCADLPRAGTYHESMDADCSGCKARAALSSLNTTTA